METWDVALNTTLPGLPIIKPNILKEKKKIKQISKQGKYYKDYTQLKIVLFRARKSHTSLPLNSGLANTVQKPLTD